MESDSSTPKAAVRYNCPYPGCNRSFRDFWRLKVHYRAQPGARGSGVERGHGQELPHCPVCMVKLDDVKYHKCSAGHAAHAASAQKYKIVGQAQQGPAASISAVNSGIISTGSVHPLVAVRPTVTWPHHLSVSTGGPSSLSSYGSGAVGALGPSTQLVTTHQDGHQHHQQQLLQSVNLPQHHHLHQQQQHQQQQQPQLLPGKQQWVQAHASVHGIQGHVHPELHQVHTGQGQPVSSLNASTVGAVAMPAQGSHAAGLPHVAGGFQHQYHLQQHHHHHHQHHHHGWFEQHAAQVVQAHDQQQQHHHQQHQTQGQWHAQAQQQQAAPHTPTYATALLHQQLSLHPRHVATQLLAPVLSHQQQQQHPQPVQVPQQLSPVISLPPQHHSNPGAVLHRPSPRLSADGSLSSFLLPRLSVDGAAAFNSSTWPPPPSAGPSASGTVPSAFKPHTAAPATTKQDELLPQSHFAHHAQALLHQTAPQQQQQHTFVRPPAAHGTVVKGGCIPCGSGSSSSEGGPLGSALSEWFQGFTAELHARVHMRRDTALNPSDTVGPHSSASDHACHDSTTQLGVAKSWPQLSSAAAAVGDGSASEVAADNLCKAAGSAPPASTSGGLKEQQAQQLPEFAQKIAQDFKLALDELQNALTHNSHCQELLEPRGAQQEQQQQQLPRHASSSRSNSSPDNHHEKEALRSGTPSAGQLQLQNPDLDQQQNPDLHQQQSPDLDQQPLDEQHEGHAQHQAAAMPAVQLSSNPTDKPATAADCGTVDVHAAAAAVNDVAPDPPLDMTDAAAASASLALAAGKAGQPAPLSGSGGGLNLGNARKRDAGELAASSSLQQPSLSEHDTDADTAAADQARTKRQRRHHATCMSSSGSAGHLPPLGSKARAINVAAAASSVNGSVPNLPLQKAAAAANCCPSQRPVGGPTALSVESPPRAAEGTASGSSGASTPSQEGSSGALRPTASGTLARVVLSDTPPPPEAPAALLELAEQMQHTSGLLQLPPATGSTVRAEEHEEHGLADQQQQQVLIEHDRTAAVATAALAAAAQQLLSLPAPPDGSNSEPCGTQQHRAAVVSLMKKATDDARACGLTDPSLLVVKLMSILDDHVSALTQMDSTGTEQRVSVSAAEVPTVPLVGNALAGGVAETQQQQTTSGACTVDAPAGLPVAAATAAHPSVAAAATTAAAAAAAPTTAIAAPNELHLQQVVQP